MRLHFVEARSADLCDSITYKYTFRALLVILGHYSLCARDKLVLRGNLRGEPFE